MENLVNLLPCYQGKKVFVTGHTGFKGTWLTACLHLLGATVKGYSLAPECQGTLFELLTRQQVSESIIDDIRNRTRLHEEIQSFQPDFIFHLAAQPLVRRSYEIPAETYEVNVVGTANVLESVRSLQRHCTIIVVTTDKVYENKEQDILYKEEDSLGGYDAYSSSKACAELVVHAFRKSFFHPQVYSAHQKAVASARAGNVIGGGDWSKDRIIPDIIRALQNQETIEVRNPHAIRPWQHVLEPVTGYLQLGQCLTADPKFYSKPYNFGPMADDHLTVKELVEHAIRCWGKGKWISRLDTSQPHEAGLLKLSIRRAIEELNWSPKLKADDAVKWTVDWYRRPEHERAAFSIRQIKDYFAL